MNKYEAVIILNPNLSSKVDSFLKEFETLLSSNSFKIIKTEDVGRRQLAYSINNHNKGHYLLFNLEGDPSKLIEIENKIKYNESIIRHLFINVKSHNGEDSQLLVESKTKKKDSEVEDISSKVEAKETIETEKKDNKEEDADKMEDKTKTENDSVEVKDE
tara:strand:+ start:2859 stop:3338 length:480 start_codon:yes stop_codon:yes gene_type:complete